MSQEKKYYTIQEMAMECLVGDHVVYHAIINGDIAAIQLGKLWRIPVEELQEMQGLLSRKSSVNSIGTLQEGKYYTSRQVANLFDVSPSSVGGWCSDGRIRAEKFNGAWAIPADEVIRMQRDGV